MTNNPRSAGRIAAAALAAAGLALAAVSAGILFELDREGRVHRDVLEQLERNDRAEDVRAALAQLGHASRLVAILGTPESAATVDRLANEIEAGLEALAPMNAAAGAPQAEIFRTSRSAISNARSVVASRAARGEGAAEAPARETEVLAQKAADLVDHYVGERSAQINRATAAQLRIGSALRTAVIGALVGSMALMALLFALYRAARLRERAALARAEHLAHFDPLTAMPNRASLQERLDQEIARARRNDQRFAVLMFDLDGFKHVNDTWGHGAGDNALAIAAQRAREAVRGSDTVGRLGGDEFLAILPDTDIEGATAVAEKLRESLGRPYALEAGIAGMSISMGVALFPRHGTDARGLMTSVDAALYEAKRRGKDRYAVATS